MATAQSTSGDMDAQTLPVGSQIELRSSAPYETPQGRGIPASQNAPIINQHTSPHKNQTIYIKILITSYLGEKHKTASVPEPPSSSHTLKTSQRSSLQLSSSTPAAIELESTLETSNAVGREEETRTSVILIPCESCGASFASKKGLDRHLEKKHREERRAREKPVPCPECPRRFTSVPILKRHMLTHSGERPFACRFCSKGFNQRGTLTNHLRTHTGETPFHCPMCPKRFKSASASNSHIRSVHGGDKFQCTLGCGETFVLKSQLQRHVRTHNGKRAFPCCECDLICSSKAVLRNHLRTHTGDRPFLCQICANSYHTRQGLVNHLKQKHNFVEPDGPEVCSVCGKVVVNKSAFYHHMETHRRERDEGTDKLQLAIEGILTEGDATDPRVVVEEIRSFSVDPQETNFLEENEVYNTHGVTEGSKACFSCEICGETFPRKSALRRHIHSHAVNPSRLQCHCGSTFSTVNGLRKHSWKHLPEGPPTCQECGKSFTSSKGLERHSATHRGDSMIFKGSGPFQCPVCSNFFSQSHIRCHIRTHQEEQPFICEECGATFKFKANLKRHLFLVHGNNPGVMCPECGKVLRSEASLKEHLLTHADKLVPCPECNEKFHSTSSLRAHTSRRHGQATIPCPKCSKVFPSKSVLSNHLRSHSDIRAHVCTLCGKCFKGSSSLKKHIFAHTNERPFKCSRCPASFTSSSDLKRHSRTHEIDVSCTCHNCGEQVPSRAALIEHEMHCWLPQEEVTVESLL